MALGPAPSEGLAETVLRVKRFFQHAAVPRHTARGESPGWRDPNLAGKHDCSIAAKHFASPSCGPNDQGSMPTAGSLERAFTSRNDASPWLRDLGLSDPLCRESQQAKPHLRFGKAICAHLRLSAVSQKVQRVSSELFAAGRTGVFARNSATSKRASEREAASRYPRRASERLSATQSDWGRRSRTHGGGLRQDVASRRFPTVKGSVILDP